MDAAHVASKAYKFVSATAQAAEKSADLARVTLFVDPSCAPETRALLQNAFVPQNFSVALAIQSAADPARLTYLAGSDVCVIATAQGSESVALCVRAAQHARVPACCVGSATGQLHAQLSDVGLSDDELTELVGLPMAQPSDLHELSAWLNAHCEKNQTLASAFPFMQQSFERQAIFGAAASNALAGALLGKRHDMPAMCVTQASLAFVLANLHGTAKLPLLATQGACVAAGAFACRALARRLQQAAPILGPVIRASIGFGGTLAMGMFFSAQDKALAGAATIQPRSGEE